MDTPLINHKIIEQGFYVDPDTRRMFFVQKLKDGGTLVPVWVKSKPSDWKQVARKRDGNNT